MISIGGVFHVLILTGASAFLGSAGCKLSSFGKFLAFVLLTITSTVCIAFLSGLMAA